VRNETPFFRLAFEEKLLFLDFLPPLENFGDLEKKLIKLFMKKLGVSGACYA
jgi:hypothetical protein